MKQTFSSFSFFQKQNKTINMGKRGSGTKKAGQKNDTKIREAKKQTGRTLINPREHLLGAKFRLINEKLYNMKVSQGAKYLKENPEVFKQYHEGFRLQVQSWPIIPSHMIEDIIIKKFGTSTTSKKNSNVKIADLGCGDGYIGSKLDGKNINNVSFHVDSVDACIPNMLKDSVVKKEKGVTYIEKPFHFYQCSMSEHILSENSYDVVAISLALMGTDCIVNKTVKEGKTPISEAWRCLKENSLLIIAEVGSRIKNQDSFVELVKCVGFECVSKMDYNYFIIFQFVKKSENRKEPSKKLLSDGSLKPGQYKKR